MALCGAQEVTFLATLESSSEASRWRRMVVLVSLSTSLLDKVTDLRFGYHMSLEKHFVELTLGVDKVFLGIWQVKPPIDKMGVHSSHGRLIRGQYLSRL